MQIWAESGKSALPICNYSQILYQFLTFTQNLKRSLGRQDRHFYFRLFLLSRKASNATIKLPKDISKANIPMKIEMIS